MEGSHLVPAMRHEGVLKSVQRICRQAQAQLDELMMTVTDSVTAERCANEVAEGLKVAEEAFRARANELSGSDEASVDIP